MGSCGFNHSALPDLIHIASAAEHRAHEIVLGRVLWTAGVAGLLVLRAKNFRGADSDAGAAARPALRAGDVSALDLCILGMVLAAGLRSRVAARGTVALRLRARHAFQLDSARLVPSRLWSASRSYSAPICFLWFKDDWFYLQFVLVAVGVLGKEFVRWNREGRYVHIFNPSAFTLGLFSVVLLSTGTTHLTWGQEIASTLSLAPQIYLYLFLVGLVVLYFFSVTLVTASAAAVLMGFSAVYASLNGVPYFLDSEIPSAVFLGLHLLVTDPSTSPRTPLGRLLFGVLYGCGVFGLYSLLASLGPADLLRQTDVRALAEPERAVDRSVLCGRSASGRLLHRLGSRSRRSAA